MLTAVSIQDMHLAKRYYDMAASASVDAHVPTMLANAKLLTKLHIEWLIQFYKVGTFKFSVVFNCSRVMKFSLIFEHYLNKWPNK